MIYIYLWWPLFVVEAIVVFVCDNDDCTSGWRISPDFSAETSHRPNSQILYFFWQQSNWNNFVLKKLAKYIYSFFKGAWTTTGWLTDCRVSSFPSKANRTKLESTRFQKKTKSKQTALQKIDRYKCNLSLDALQTMERTSLLYCFIK